MLERPVINRRGLPRHSVMIHRIRTVRPNLHLENRIRARPADPLDRDPDASQILSQPPVIDRQLNKVANPLWRKFHSGACLCLVSEYAASTFFSRFSEAQVTTTIKKTIADPGIATVHGMVLCRSILMSFRRIRLQTISPTFNPLIARIRRRRPSSSVSI